MCELVISRNLGVLGVMVEQFVDPTLCYLARILKNVSNRRTTMSRHGTTIFCHLSLSLSDRNLRS